MTVVPLEESRWQHRTGVGRRPGRGMQPKLPASRPRLHLPPAVTDPGAEAP